MNNIVEISAGMGINVYSTLYELTIVVTDDPVYMVYKDSKNKVREVATFDYYAPSENRIYFTNAVGVQESWVVDEKVFVIRLDTPVTKNNKDIKKGDIILYEGSILDNYYEQNNLLQPMIRPMFYTNVLEPNYEDASLMNVCKLGKKEIRTLHFRVIIVKQNYNVYKKPTEEYIRKLKSIK